MYRQINTSELPKICKTLTAGTIILLSGEVYTARDAAHKELIRLIENKETLPFDIMGKTIYYAGPTEAPENLPIGSCGPTTSGRMDSFTPTLLDMGLTCMIGKGPRSEEVKNSIIKNGAVYLLAVGGAGALAAENIVSCEEVAFSHLGCESIKKLIFKDFPLVVGIDSLGNSVCNT